MIDSQIRHGFLGRTLYLSSGNIELEVTLDVGPRIISLSKKGGQNIMFNDINDAINKDVSEIYGSGERWHIYGGHRIWISPEEEKTYYPDNNVVEYQILENGARFMPQVWRVWQVQPLLEILFLDSDKLEVKMTLTNLSTLAQDLSVWGLTVLKCGGTMTMDLDTSNTGYLANRNIVFWHYTDIKDKRFSLENDKLSIKSDVGCPKPFKIGLFKRDLRVEYKIGDSLFIKSVVAKDGVYPDYFCNMETYTSDLIHEVETLSPIVKVESGKSVTHSEIWQLK